MKPGVGFIAAKAKVPVVPAIIDGTHKAWPRGKKYPVLKRISVSYGKPLDVSMKDVRSFQPRLEKAISGLLNDIKKTRR